MTEIVVRVQVVGFHNWPSAPEHRSYLAVRHRHVFHVEVTTTVKHDDREIEFHDLQSETLMALAMFRVPAVGSYKNPDAVYEFGSNSCEMIAHRVAGYLKGTHQRFFTVAVFEDGECGARVTV